MIISKDDPFLPHKCVPPPPPERWSPFPSPSKRAGLGDLLNNRMHRRDSLRPKTKHPCFCLRLSDRSLVMSFHTLGRPSAWRGHKASEIATMPFGKNLSKRNRPFGPAISLVMMQNWASLYLPRAYRLIRCYVTSGQDYWAFFFSHLYNGNKIKAHDSVRVLILFF